MAQSATAIYIILVPALFLPYGEVARTIEAKPVKFFELLGRNTRVVIIIIITNVFTLCFMLGQTLFSVLDSQPVLILLHATYLPRSSLKELRKEGEEFPH